ncbi:MAG: hypothetical protein K2M50_03630 [Treponemataceae bacterium]|nr:hypothetical protein [Treponemataceae bacterium]
MMPTAKPQDEFLSAVLFYFQMFGKRLEIVKLFFVEKYRRDFARKMSVSTKR